MEQIRAAMTEAWAAWAQFDDDRGEEIAATRKERDRAWAERDRAWAERDEARLRVSSLERERNEAMAALAEAKSQLSIARALLAEANEARREPGRATLSFDRLRVGNVRRCEEVFHPLHRWNPLEWAGAMCGEAGEAANAAKKVIRGDKDATTDAIAEEVADVVLYGDLLCARIGANLGAAIRRKFNSVSVERGSEVRL